MCIMKTGLKNRSGGIADFRVPNKVVTIQVNRLTPERCHVRILDEYIARAPKTAQLSDAFYLQCMPSIDCGIPDAPWYKKQRLGVNKLQGMVKNMCLQAGISGHKTNHSLRASCATQMYEANVPEKIIKDCTGHRSLEALRKYERPSKEQLLASGDVLDSTHPITFQRSGGKVSKEKENADPQTLTPTSMAAPAQVVSWPNSATQSENKYNFSPKVPEMTIRPVSLHNCQIQVNLGPNRDAATLDLFDEPFKEDAPFRSSESFQLETFKASWCAAAYCVVEGYRDCCCVLCCCC
jgi:hypothetical protein